MRRYVVLLLFLALFGTACASTAVVTATSTGATSSDSGDTPLESVEFEPAELGRPVAESPAMPDPTSEPSATPVPTVAPVRSATPVPTQTSVPTLTPEADATGPLPLVDAEEPSFDTLVADSLARIDTAAVVQVVLDRSIGPGEQNDYSSRAGVVIDRAADLERAVVALSGAGWDGLATRNDLTRLRTEDRYELLVAGDTFYMTATPGLAGLTTGTSWLQARTVDFVDQQGLQFDSVIVTDPNEVLSEVQALLRLNIEPTEVSLGTYLINVPNAEILQLAPGSSILPLVALDQVANQDPDMSAFVGTSPVQFFFEGGLIERITVDLSPVFAELPTVGGTNAFEGIEISETYTVSLGSAAVLSLPTPDTVTDPTDLYPDRQPNGQCLTRDEGEGDPADVEVDAAVIVGVPCTEPHRWEVIETDRYEDAFGAPYPDVDVLLEVAIPRCNAAVEDLLSISLVTTDVIVDVQTPTGEGWAAGDRQYACLAKFSQLVDQRAADIDFTQFGGKAQRGALVAGQCVRDEGIEQLHFAVVDCAEPHFYEVYLRFAVETETGAYPGEEAVLEQADERCVNYIEVRVTSDDLKLEWQVQALIPSAGTWATLNDRDVVCLATTRQLETGVQFAGVPEPLE